MGWLAGYNFTTSQAAGFASGTIKAVYDNMRAIDLLSTLDYADTTKLAAIGHSLGGHNSLFTAVMDTRIKVVRRRDQPACTCQANPQHGLLCMGGVLTSLLSVARSLCPPADGRRGTTTQRTPSVPPGHCPSTCPASSPSTTTRRPVEPRFPPVWPPIGVHLFTGDAWLRAQARDAPRPRRGRRIANPPH